MHSAETISFMEATHNRRSIRSLQAASPVPDTAVVELAEKAILDVPSAFNSQSTRMIVLFGENHKKLWTIAATLFKAKLGEQRFNEPSGGKPSFKEKLSGYLDSYGTILFWDDMSVAEKLKETSPAVYKDKIEDWVHQSNGMHQYYMWTALEAFGLGANLQHYNPIIDDEVKKTWEVSELWTLRAQLVFGTPVNGVDLVEKVQNLPVTERLKIFGFENERAAI